MNDEKYSFVQDVIDKKVTARSARNKRTHNGRGGAVKFPSDYLSKKELQKMSGECKSYRLNEPMTWAEFNTMPDDIKVTYIKLLRQKYDVPDVEIGLMFGVGKALISRSFDALGLRNETPRSSRKKWDKEAWLGFVHGYPVISYREALNPTEDTDVCAEAEEVKPQENACEPVCEAVNKRIIPCCGSLTFEGSAEDALRTASALLGGGKCPHNNHMVNPGRRVCWA